MWLSLFVGCAELASDPVALKRADANTTDATGAVAGDAETDTAKPECVLSSDCAGKVGQLGPCDVPVCVPGAQVCAAVTVAPGTPCTDGDACTIGELCGAVGCAGGTATVCDDDNPCTADSCVGGCVFTPTTASCDDGNPCTVGDACAAGACTPSGLRDCDDDTPCTLDSCDAQTDGATPCTHLPVAAACSDDDPCTGGDACAITGAAAGTCVGGAAIDCDDSNGCTADSCADQAGGVTAGDCVHLPIEATCSDGDVCTAGDSCQGGACVGGQGTCQCKTDADCAKLDDGNLCNGVLTCKNTGSSSFCAVSLGSVVTCTDDGNPCTSVACAAKSAKCVVSAKAGACADGDGCTTGDSCNGMACVGSAVTCDDKNPCTADACNTVCSHVAIAAACDDGDACTAGDSCVDGQCKAKTSKVCDDKSPCTNDTCVKGVCTFINNVAACNDGVACTLKDVCAAGVCKGSPSAVACSDGSSCTDDTCDASKGCAHANNGSCKGCKGLACLACATKKGCVGAGFAAGTCCKVGDPLLYLSKGPGEEVVDLEVDPDGYAYLCGGFGVRVANVSTPAKPQATGTLLQRCQRIAVGAKIGARVMYFAHHGDSWVTTPFLVTAHRDGTGALKEVHRISDKKVLFEGLAWQNGHLFAATHGDGLRAYTTNPTTGVPKLLSKLGGFTNAWKIAMAPDRLWVADGAGGIKTVDRSKPAAMKILQSAPTSNFARDVDASIDRVFAALGGGGVDVFNRNKDGTLKLITNLTPLGSSQAVSVHGGALAVANWTHVAVYDAANLHLLATEKVRNFPKFEQDFGVVIRDKIVYVGEWEGLHTLQLQQDTAAPDLWVGSEALTLKGTKGASRVVIVENRGNLPLEISSLITVPATAFSVWPTKLTLAPQAKAAVEIIYLGPTVAGMGVTGQLTLHTNDPDAAQATMQVLIQVSGGQGGLTVGSAIDQKFGFLDPTGAKQVANLKGKVVVLAYFALF